MRNMIDKIFHVKNKNIVLTGSSGRLGQQHANFLSEAGANMILIDIDNKSNSKFSSQLKKKYKTNPNYYTCDITKKDELKKISKLIIKEYSVIDGLINNAGFTTSFAKKEKKSSYSSSFEDFPLELWNQTLSVNLTGSFLCCQEFGRHMVKQKKGSIINIASHYGLIAPDQRIYGNSGLNLPISYAASKSGILNLTRYLASYWRGKNIRVNTLTPGGVLDKKLQSKEFIKKYSEKTILNRLANPDEYNAAILFLISDASSYMTGSNLIIDGGWTSL